MSAVAANPREAAARRYFEALGAGDYGAFFALWCEDGVFDMPFVPPGMPDRQDGKAALEAFYRGVRGGMRSSHTTIDRVIPAADPHLLVVEGHGAAVLSNGRAYDNRYIWIFTFAEDGRVRALREYADPLVIQNAFRPEQTP